MIRLVFFCFIFISEFSIAQVANRWQQRADYKMNIDFNVSSHQFEGTQTIEYTNHSPDTLDQIFYHLYFNAFQPNSMMDMRSRTIEDPDRRVGDRIYHLEANEIGYHRVNSLKIDGKKCEFEIVGTILEVSLPKSILPNKKVKLEMEFESQVPEQIRRSGRNNAEGISYSMSQWYPKLCEYDYQGWHSNPYVGREFHGVWGNFDVKIRIDGTYIVAATGIQKSKHEYTRSTSNNREWHYIAKNVHDFVWAADPDYSYTEYIAEDGTIIECYFEPGEERDKNWNQLPKIMAAALKFMNKRYGKYPYPIYKFIQGGDGGMEYPMATLITANRSLASLVGVSVHEWMHSWYQMVLATNEALYPWMDEGFTSFATTETMNYLRENGFLTDRPAMEDPFTSVYQGYFSLVKSGKEEAIITHADHYHTNRAYGMGSYTKGQLFLRQLEYIIGKEAFDKTLLKYYYTWNFKHPNDNDFIRIAEKISNLELDWYKEHWVHSTNTIDYGITHVQQSGKEKGLIFLNKLGKMPMPLDVRVLFEDGTAQIFNIPLRIMRGSKSMDIYHNKIQTIEDWPWTHSFYPMTIETFGKTIKSVVIDPSNRMADVNRSNNVWRKMEF